MQEPKTAADRVRSRRMPTYQSALIAVGVGLFSTACDGAATDGVQVRIVENGAAVRWNATVAERFGLVAPGAGMALESPGKDIVEGSSGPRQSASGLSWQLPGGWGAVAPTSMRIANFTAGDGGEVECYVTTFPGDGGGLLPNVNRWRGQLGLGATTLAELDSLPKLSVLGGEHPWIVLTEESGAQGGGMLAVVAPHGSRTFFVKLVGPSEAVQAERSRFQAFCESLQEN